MTYSGRWRPSTQAASQRAQYARHEERMRWTDRQVENQAWRDRVGLEEEADDVDVDRLDFEADGRL